MLKFTYFNNMFTPTSVNQTHNTRAILIIYLRYLRYLRNKLLTMKLIL